LTRERADPSRRIEARDDAMLETQRNLELVRAVNDLFYEAVEQRDLEKMSRVWHHSSAARCVHPGWEVLTGWESIRESFEAMFQNRASVRFWLSDLQIRIHGSIAVVSLVENLLTRALGCLSFCDLQATNLFRKVNGKWRMIHHHASPFVRHMTTPPLSLN